MKMEEIRGIARGHEIKTGSMKKAELIRAIQRAEHNEPCFEAVPAGKCTRNGCLWWSDCQ